MPYSDNSIRLALERRSSGQGAAASADTLAGKNILTPQERDSILRIIDEQDL